MGMKKKSDEAKSVLSKVSGGTNATLVQSAFKEWKTIWTDEKHARLMDENDGGIDVKFKNLSKKQKGAARNMQEKGNRLEEENQLLLCLKAWECQARLEKIINH